MTVEKLKYRQGWSFEQRQNIYIFAFVIETSVKFTFE